jgi:hypothetical protein
LYVLQEELAERASWLLAEEEVLLMEQQQAAASGAAASSSEGLAASPSSILDSLTATDINKMKVSASLSAARPFSPVLAGCMHVCLPGVLLAVVNLLHRTVV